MSNNLISSLAPVSRNPHYSQLEQLSARGNLVMYLSDLAGSPFLEQNLPTTIDLQDNQIQKVRGGLFVTRLLFFLGGTSGKLDLCAKVRRVDCFLIFFLIFVHFLTQLDTALLGPVLSAIKRRHFKVTKDFH